MTTRDEIAFLNSLLSMGEDEIPKTQNTCPEPAVLWSLTQEDRADSVMVRELRAHAATCSSCADLSKRLHVFHQTTEGINGDSSAVADREWEQSKARLDTWMRGHLSSQRGGHATRRWTWRLPAMPWGLQAAAVTCALVLVAMVVVWDRHGWRMPESPAFDMASQSSNRDAEQPSALPAPNDKNVLMRGNGESGSEKTTGNRPTITISGGEHMKLWLTAIQSDGDGGYKFEGKLFPLARKGDMFYTADVTAFVSGSQSEDGFSLLVLEATMKDKIYRPAGGVAGTRLTAAFVKNREVAPKVGATLEIEISEGQLSLTAEP